MPGRVKVRILNARDLPIMDRASELTDAFVEVRFGPDTFKTEVCKKSLNPQWNSDWFKFEADDEVLQDEPLDLKVLDYDTYSSHDTIGKVYIDLNPLLCREAPNTISGWFPIFDTMHGLRGELNVQVRMELFTDFNKFRQSSCGIQLFCSCEVPSGWRIQAMLGFIEELVVNDDPEHQWIEKIRTPRASNEARQRLFSKLSGTLQRKLGVKVLEMGGNAVLGYFQNFDLEGESGIVVRAIGTAVSLSKVQIGLPSPAVLPSSVSPGKDTRRHSLSLHHSSHHHHHNHHHHHHHHSHHHHHHSHHKHQHHQDHTHHHHQQGNQSAPVLVRQASSPTSGGEAATAEVSSPPLPYCMSSKPELSNGGGGNFSSGCYYDGRSPPPTAPPVVHEFQQSALGKSPSVFNFPSSPAAFPEGAVSPTSSSNTASNSATPTPTPTAQQPKTLQAMPNMAPPEATSSAVVSESASAIVVPTEAPVVGPGQQQQQQQQQQENPSASGRQSISPIRVTPEPERTRRSSESEVNSPPRAGSTSLVGTPMNLNVAPRLNIAKSNMFQQSIDLLEYPFFTIRTFPVGFIASLGGVVSARSVKLLDKIHNPEEPQTRDAWWSELRVEIKSHALKLGCHAVLGYNENTTICDEVIILSACGTAAKINLAQESSSINNAAAAGATGAATSAPTGTSAPSVSPVSGSGAGVGGGGSQPVPVEKVASSTGSSGSAGAGGPASMGKEGKDKHLFVDIGLANQALQKSAASVDVQDEVPATNCSLCHIPYCPSNLPFEIQLSKCAICRKKNVPEVLFTTIDPPADIPIWSKGCLVQARICRGRSNKNKSSEQSAREVSDILPFIEYEVHNQLINKLKIRGLNALFGLKIQVVLGDNMIIAIGTATGAYLGPLPLPPQPIISTEVATANESQDLMTLQKRITRTVQMHRERLNSEIVERQGDISPHSRPPTDDESEDEEVDDGNFFLEKTKDKNTFVLVIDDVKDESVSLMLHDIVPPDGFDVCNTQTLPGVTADKIVANLQMFTQMLTVKFQPTLHNSLDFSNVFNGILRRLCFKLRHFRPCCLTDIAFHVDIPDEDEMNVTVTGCCLGLQDMPTDPGPALTSAARIAGHSRSLESQPSSASMSVVSQTEEMIFPLEGVGDQAGVAGSESSQPTHQSRQGSVSGRSTSSKALTRQSKIVMRPKTLKGIELTPLNKIYNGKIDKYLGYYNFFFIRESTAVREGGGIGGFLQSFNLEVKAIVRAHVVALGGNALVAYNMIQCVLDDNPHKNQGQCLINVSGDVVVVCYDEDERDSTLTEALVTVPAS